MSIIYQPFFTVTTCILFVVSFSILCGQPPQSKFSQETRSLQAYYNIDGLSVLVKRGDTIVYEDYIGYSRLQDSAKVNKETLFPIASLTKIFAGIVLLQYVEEKRVSLDEPIFSYLSNKNISKAIKIKHILSHTSQGTIGKDFYYSNRFAWLTQVIEKVGGKSFAMIVSEKVLRPAGMTSTHFLSDSTTTQIISNKLATGYIIDRDSQKREAAYDYQVSASSGMVSNVADLALFDNALNRNILLQEQTKNLFFQPFLKHSPYSLGIFSQTAFATRIVWGYGQLKNSASLFVKVPVHNLTLIVTANNNAMNNMSHLIHGDVTMSLFVLQFLRNFIPEVAQHKEFQPRYQFAHAFNAVNLLRQTPDKKVSSDSLHLLLQSANDTTISISLVHQLIFFFNLRIITKTKDFDKEIIRIAHTILRKQPNHPYTLFYIATLYDIIGNQPEAKRYFLRLINNKNFDPSWYTEEARLFMNRH